MILEDNNGFVFFPPMDLFNKVPGKTLIYLVAFDVSDISSRYVLSNLKLEAPVKFVTDDISGRYLGEEEEGGYYSENMYLTSAICIGWNDFSYNLRENNAPWYATFRDLSNEGRKLYYSMKKLHNNKEVRILTFNLF